MILKSVSDVFQNNADGTRIDDRRNVDRKWRNDREVNRNKNFTSMMSDTCRESQHLCNLEVNCSPFYTPRIIRFLSNISFLQIFLLVSRDEKYISFYILYIITFVNIGIVIVDFCVSIIYDFFYSCKYKMYYSITIIQ